MGPGEYFGEISLIDGLPRAATVTATTPLRTISLVARAFGPILDSEPEVGKALLKVLCAGSVPLEDDVSARRSSHRLISPAVGFVVTTSHVRWPSHCIPHRFGES